MFAKDETNTGYFVGTKLPTYKEEAESKEYGIKIKGAPKKRTAEWDSTGLSYYILMFLFLLIFYNLLFL